MYRNDHKTTPAIWLLAFWTMGVTLGSLLVQPALAQDEEPVATETAAAPEAPVRDATLTELGLELEAARLKSALGDRSAAEALAQSLRNVDAPKDSEAAVHLLWGHVYNELGEYDEAAAAFDKARRKAGDEDLETVAEFRRIEALEAVGQDDEAAKLWLKWLGSNEDHALAADARLHMAWNRIRRGEVTTAAGDLANLDRNHSWITTDNRYRLAKATAS